MKRTLERDIVLAVAHWEADFDHDPQECPICLEISRAVKDERERGEKLKIELERLIEVHLMDCEEDCVAIEVARKAVKEWEADHED